MTGEDLLIMLHRSKRKQTELATYLGVAKVTVSKYVRGALPILPQRERQIREWFEMDSPPPVPTSPIRDSHRDPTPEPPAGEHESDSSQAAEEGNQSRSNRTPHAFLEGEGSVPNNPLIATGLESIFKGGDRARSLTGGWQTSETGRPVYLQQNRTGGRIRVYPQLRNNPSDPMPTAATEWQLVTGLSAFTGDITLAVLAQLCEPSTGDKPKYPMLESVRITADAILSYKGMRRYGEERRELEARVHEEMQRLQALSFDLEQQPAIDPKTGVYDERCASWEADRLFDIVKVTEYRRGPKGTAGRVEVSWMVRAGQWAQWWLNPETKVWLAHMAQVLLELDHRPNSGAEYMAKKMGQRLMLMTQAMPRSAPLTIRIEQLLEKVGELPVPSERGPNWGRRTRERFDNALLSLQEADVLANISWPDGHGPGQEDYGRGWVDKWLAARVIIRLPRSAPESPALRPQPDDDNVASFNGPALRAARTERGWRQAPLARHLGITVQYLSLLENGKRIPSAELMQKITDWLERFPIPS